MPEDKPLSAPDSAEDATAGSEPNSAIDPEVGLNAEQPVATQPVAEQPVAKQPVAEQPVTKQSVAEQPVERAASQREPASESAPAASARNARVSPPRSASRPSAAPDSKKPGLVKAPKGKLALPQSLQRTGSVVKVASSKILRDTGEGLVGFSQWLEGRTSEEDIAQATKVQEDLEDRFETSWQKWGSILDQAKAPLPKKARRISNARITGLLVGILVFLWLALSAAFSSPGSAAKDADAPLRRSPQSKLVKSRSAEGQSASGTSASAARSSRAKTNKAPINSTQASDRQPERSKTSKSDKNLSAADFFGEDSPKQAPPLNRPAPPPPRIAKSSESAASPAAPLPYPYPGYGAPGYGIPGYGTPGYAPPPDAQLNAPAAAAAYPPPYPYPPYFYPPPGYVGGDDAASQSPGADSGGSLPPYGSYAPYPYYPVPPVLPQEATATPTQSDAASPAERQDQAQSSPPGPSSASAGRRSGNLASSLPTASSLSANNSSRDQASFKAGSADSQSSAESSGDRAAKK